MVIDVKWFQDRLRDADTSQRQASLKFTKSPNTLSLILSGKRGVQHYEIPMLAQILSTTNEEVLKRLGVNMPASTKDDTVEVIGALDETGKVTVKAIGGHATAPANATAATKALVFQSPTGGFQHGWLYFFDQLASGRAKPVDVSTFNALAVIQIGDRDDYQVGVITRGIEPGRFDIAHPFIGTALIKDVAIRNAMPVTWIRCAA